MRELLLSPLGAMAIFLVLAGGLYRLGGILAAKGDEHPGKREPYACGEDMAPSQAKLAYHGFFRLALTFAVLHLATLVIATLPRGGASPLVAMAYITGIAVSVLVLTEGAT